MSDDILKCSAWADHYGPQATAQMLCQQAARIAELESDLATARKDGVMWQEAHAAYGQRIAELREAVKVLAAEVVAIEKLLAAGTPVMKPVGYFLAASVLSNPIAAAAVREVSNASR